MCVCVQAMALTQQEKMRESFKDVEHFSATSDIWSRSNNSFIAVSVHYFEPKTLSLKTNFIACEHFRGHHTSDKVFQKLKSIFDRYNILERVNFVTTDGAGEYVAAFKYFEEEHQSIRITTTSDENLSFLGRATNSSVTVEEASSSNPNEILDGDAESESDLDDDFELFVRAHKNADANFDVDLNAFRVHEFPPLSLQSLSKIKRIECSAHKLDKVGKIDCDLAKGKDEDYDALHDKVFSKLESIWNLKDSRLSAEIFTRITGKKLIGPHRIRWMKTCEAVSFFHLFIS